MNNTVELFIKLERNENGTYNFEFLTKEDSAVEEVCHALVRALACMGNKIQTIKTEKFISLTSNAIASLMEDDREKSETA